MKLYYNQVSDNILNIKESKRNECYNFGLDNAFPSLIEILISGSVTAKTCSDRVSKAIYGKGFGEAGKVIVNSKGQSLNEVFRIASRQYAKHNNVFIQISYDANLDIKAIVVIQNTDVRIGKSDDRGYSGKFIVYNNWDKLEGGIKPENFKKIDKYNPNKSIIRGQIYSSVKNQKNKKQKDLKIENVIQNYNGQILHIRKDDTYIYSLPDLNPVIPEALLEFNSQTFRCTGSERGFLNTKLLTVPPFASEEIKREFKKDLNSYRGAKGSNDMLLLETSQPTEDVSKQINISDLSGNYNDKLFEYSDKQAEKNICKAYTVPLILVSQTDNSLFGNSGAMLKEAKLQLWESREEDRNQLSEVFNSIIKSFQDDKKNEGEIEVINPFMNIEIEKSETNE